MYLREETLDNALPWMAIAAAALALVDTTRPSGERQPEQSVAGPSLFWQEWASIRFALATCLGAGIAAAAAGYFWKDSAMGLDFVGYGVLIGAVLVCLAETFERALKGTTPSAPIGLATAACGVVLLFEDGRDFVWLGLAFGASVLSALTGSARYRWSRIAAISVAALCAASILGMHRSDISRAVGAPTLVAVMATVALVLAHSLGKFASRQAGRVQVAYRWQITVGLLALIGGAKLIAAKYIFLNDFFLTVAGGVLSAAFVVWSLRDDEESSVGAYAISTLIWLAWATVAFGLLKGYGVAISAFVGAVVASLAGAHKAMVSVCLLVAYSLYRVFLEQYASDARAVDISQHYAIIGIVAGATLPIALAQWGAAVRSKYASTAGITVNLAGGIIAIAIIVGACFVVGPRGSVGLMVGFALASVAMSLGGNFGLAAAVLSCGFAAFLTIAFGHISDKLMIDRDSKTQYLLYAIAAALVLLWSGTALLRKNQKEANA
jgi:hypothetical protein